MLLQSDRSQRPWDKYPYIRYNKDENVHQIRMIERRVREGEREKEGQKERYREGGRDKRERERDRKRDREIEREREVKGIER